MHMCQENKQDEFLFTFADYICRFIFVLYSSLSTLISIITSRFMWERVTCVRKSSFSCHKELVWNARLQPTTEYPIEQMEAETSQSPTGTVQSFSPTLEMLQVCPNEFPSSTVTAFVPFV